MVAGKAPDVHQALGRHWVVEAAEAGQEEGVQLSPEAGKTLTLAPGYQPQPSGSLLRTRPPQERLEQHMETASEASGAGRRDPRKPPCRQGCRWCRRKRRAGACPGNPSTECHSISPSQSHQPTDKSRNDLSKAPGQKDSWWRPVTHWAVKSHKIQARHCPQEQAGPAVLQHLF